VPGHSWRKQLPHGRPAWITTDAVHFLTVCSTPRQRNQLCHDHVWCDLLKCLQLHDERAEWQLIAAVAMPDHLHVLATIAVETSIPPMVARWKRFTARTHGVRWQRDFFEHRLRQTEHVDAKREYLRQNPVRAGLVQDPDEWPYFWSAW
jgi:REP element-mobilizing transposase RayT